MPKKKIAIIGSGISGLTCAYLLQQKHDVTIFEKAERIGGHTATIDLQHKGKEYAIDTGFIVFNDWTYPNFIKLLDKLEVKSQPTKMSFSVSCKHTGLEYGGSGFNALFAQRKNLFNRAYLKMLRDIVRFNQEAVADLEDNKIAPEISLGDYLKKRQYSDMMASHYLVPMGSAIWSASLDEILNFPLLFFVRFFKNHGLLSLKNRPQWRVLCGGSKRYLEPISQNLKHKIKLNTHILSVKRFAEYVEVNFTDGHSEKFDEVVFACHSNQALFLLDTPSLLEKTILGAIPYRNNQVVLHTDEKILPNKKAAWSAWNYHLGCDLDQGAVLSYNMNILQGIKSDDTFIVSLNANDKIDKKKIIGQYEYAHPVFSFEGIRAQQRWQEINGVERTWFCGAYWRNGFHEDGCVSGIRVAKSLGAQW